MISIPSLPPELTDPNHPAFYQKNLAELQSGAEEHQRKAIERLKSAEPKELREEITGALPALLEGHSGEVRKEALEALDRWGDDKIVSVLIGLLHDSDPTVQREVVRILADRKAPRAFPAMVPLLDEANSGARQAFLRIGSAVEPAILEQFDRLAQSGKIAACQVLIRIGTEKSLPKLKELATDGDFPLRRAAEDAIRAIARVKRTETADGGDTADDAPRRKPGKGGRLDNILFDLTLSPESRRDAVRELSRMPCDPKRCDEVAKALVAALEESDDDFLSTDILKVLKTWKSPEAVPTLVAYAQSPSYFVQREALETLSAFKEERAARAIAEQLPERPFEVVKLLLNMGSVAEPPLIEYLQHPNPRVRQQAIEILSQIGGKPSHIALNRLARGGDPRTRIMAREAAAIIRERLANQARASAAKSTSEPNPFQEVTDEEGGENDQRTSDE